MKFKRIILAAVVVPFACSALAGFEIEGTPALSTETGLMSNRTHYEQNARASFRMPDADMVPAQKKYADAKAKMVVDKAYRVVTHKGTGKAVKAFGYADSIPLDSALAMVIPAGWQVYQSADLKDEALPLAVSYEGGKEWPDVLASLGEYNALRFHIDWYDKTVMMGQGRPVYTSSLSRIRIIEEPADGGVRNRILGQGAKPNVAIASPVSKSTLVASKKPVVNAAASAAVITPAKAVEPVSAGKVADAKIVATKAPEKVEPVKSATVKPVVAVKAPVKVEPVKPSGYSLFVRDGFLHENLVRLSKENGWNAPDWQIPSDFKIASSFSVSGKSFPEAVAKLLMIHPIEADVNTNQRKIYVTKEVQ